MKVSAGQRVALARAAGGEDPAAEDDERAEPTGIGVRGDRDGVREVGRSVAVGCVGGALRAGQHDRTLVVDDEVEQEGRLLGRVRPVGDHEPRHPRVAQVLGCSRRQDPHERQAHQVATDGDDVVDPYPQVRTGGQSGDELGAAG